MDKKKIISYIQKYHMIQPGDSVIAAVSGGADSVALLLILCELSKEMSFRLFAVHVEHGIRGEESLKDMYFTENLCEKLGVPLKIYHVDAPSFAKENGLGLEEAARELRYEMLETAARELQQQMTETATQEQQHQLSNAVAGKLRQKMPEATPTWQQKSITKTGTVKIALAHHMQDQAETVLFRLARGSGLNGLAGMQPVRQGISSERQVTRGDGILERQDMRGDGVSERQVTHQDGVSERQVMFQDGLSCTYIRPLLATTRSEIEEYLAWRGQAYRVDSTNQDESYARNRIRSRVLPELTEVNAQAAAHIAQAAEQAAEINDYIAGEAARELERIATIENVEHKDDSTLSVEDNKISIEIPKLLCLHPALQRELLRQVLIRIAGHEKDLTAGHVARIMELAGKTSGKEVSLPYDVIAAREFDRLVLRKRTAVTQSGLPKVMNEKQQKWGICPLQVQQETRESACFTAEEKGISADFFEIGAEQLEELKNNGKALHVALSASEEMIFRICEVQASDGDFPVDVNEGSDQKAPEYSKEKSNRKVFDYEKIKEGFTIRHRQPGDYFFMKDGHRKKLKQYLIEEKIPVSERPNLWLLAQGPRILWLPGGREDPAFRPCGRTDFVILAEFCAFPPHTTCSLPENPVGPYAVKLEELF